MYQPAHAYFIYFMYIYTSKKYEAVERPLQVRYDQKMAKYGQVADQNNLRLIPAVFSHTGQIHEAFKIFVKEQIRAKLGHFEGSVKSSKVKSHIIGG